MNDTAPDEDEASSRPAAARLFLRSVMPGQGRRLPLGRGELRIGRSAECELVLDDERVSRVHARIEPSAGAFVVRDLGSRNGVFVDGKPAERQRLESGSVLRIAHWVGVVEEFDVEPAKLPSTDDDWSTASPMIRDVRRRMLAVAPTELPVVLQGETGTGKEVFARALHDHGERRGPFHALNCAALSPGLADAELFGHRRGAFTGADQRHAGHLLAASGGTLFLDEIGDLTLPIQAKLLRALETKEVVAVGDTQATPFEARVVAATQIPLVELTERGSFRRDLMMRLAGIVLCLPSLSERKGDIPELLQRFIAEHARREPPRLSARLCEYLCLRSWPGNVRELRLLARQLVALHPAAEQLDLGNLLECSVERPVPARHDTRAELRTDPQKDVAEFAAALRQTGGNVRAAARVSGLSRSRIYRLLRGRSPVELIRDAAGVAGSRTHDREEAKP